MLPPSVEITHLFSQATMVFSKDIKSSSLPPCSHNLHSSVVSQQLQFHYILVLPLFPTCSVKYVNYKKIAYSFFKVHTIFNILGPCLSQCSLDHLLRAIKVFKTATVEFTRLTIKSNENCLSFFHWKRRKITSIYTSLVCDQVLT